MGGGLRRLWGVWVTVFHGRPDGLLASDLPASLRLRLLTELVFWGLWMRVPKRPKRSLWKFSIVSHIFPHKSSYPLMQREILTIAPLEGSTTVH